MSKFEIKLPKLGESIEEATILKWHIKEGDLIEEDSPVVDLATDKVDSEIPSPVSGKVEKILFQEGDLVAVGKTIAIINLNPEQVEDSGNIEEINPSEKTEESAVNQITVKKPTTSHGRFYSPLVRTIANKENISIEELDSLEGSGKDGRVRKQDVLDYLKNRQSKPAPMPPAIEKVNIPVAEGDQIVPMSRMRKLIAGHMVMSEATSVHVTAVVEADVSRIVRWREQNKEAFEKKYGEKLTYMPFFAEAAALALREFPQVNASTDGENIILRKQVNIGIAVALPDWNLIVPVIKNADMKNLAGLASEINRLANAARQNKLQPDEIQGGTFSITNFGTFKNLFGTPIINQPQVAILATGSIVKRPVVIESPEGDTIAIRHMMYLALSYDHRIVDGALGGAFLRRIADLLENFDTNRSI
ncbi:MAG TPA: dihydrolipoamide acetyltransferase family protein [Bacteroidia bacterium]|nr:dihydrolipoamide acetyltransferase family protein [Bacteroidia bacterium]HRS58278.1 dihydrolipoamide acetyltransferase family protein [Bacteroidia bacterium]HRU67710.1 dihydrolipoamide acetyltransferase family protein [Bacteroidia bacterium]